MTLYSQNNSRVSQVTVTKALAAAGNYAGADVLLSLIHISEPTRPY